MSTLTVSHRARTILIVLLFVLVLLAAGCDGALNGRGLLLHGDNDGGNFQMPAHPIQLTDLLKLKAGVAVEPAESGQLRLVRRTR